MSDIVAALRTKLAATSGVTDLCSTRIYYDNLPQSAVLPAVVLELATGELADRRLASTGSLYRAAVNVYCYASTHAAAVALGEAVNAAVEFVTGTWGSVTVTRAMTENYQDLIESPRDGSDAFRYLRGLFLTIWHR